MITTFSPGRFKCFADETIALRDLTLLTGANGSGKSSLIQAVLLAREAERGHGHVNLNGPSRLQLGRASDVVNLTLPAGEDGIRLAFELADGSRTVWNLRSPHWESLVLQVDADVMHRPRLFAGMQYLCAERIGPRDTAVLGSRTDDDFDVGAQGEFVAQVLLASDRRHVVAERLHPNTAKDNVGPTLGKQVEAWMRDLVPGMHIRAESFEGANVVAIRMRRQTSEWLRPTNMAFGVTQALPIVVAGLLAATGALFIVENPEAHLHPAGQSRIGRFLATLAASGLQVIVETHSDHVLNGVRLAAADDHPLSPDQVVVQHFLPAGPAGRRVDEIRLTEQGTLTAWPRDFFDQSERDLARLIEARRRGR